MIVVPTTMKRLHPSIRYFCLTVFTLISLSAKLANGTEDWPEFRGPTGQGISDAKNAPVNLDLERDLVWKAGIPGKGWSSPVIVDGTIVLTTGSEEPESGHYALSVLAMDTERGDLLWEKAVFKPSEEEASQMHFKNSLASPTVLVSEGIVYAHFGHMGTVAMSLSDGEIIWKQKIAYQPLHGTGGSPVLVDGMLVYNQDAKDKPYVTALDARTGELAWQTSRNHDANRKFSFSTPLVVNNRGRSEIVSPGSGIIAGYRPKDGREVWRVTFPVGFSITPRPIEAEGVLYFSTGFMRPSLYAIRLDGATGDLTDSHVEWVVHRSMPKTPSPVYKDGMVFALEDAGRLSCLDAKTGEVLWMESLKANFSASPVLAGDTLYCMTEEGLYFAIGVSKEGMALRSQVDFGERSLASPAILNETIYIRTESHLWKLGNGTNVDLGS